MQVGILEQKKKRGIYIYSSYRYDTVNQFKKKKNLKTKKRTPLAPQIV